MSQNPFTIKHLCSKLIIRERIIKPVSFLPKPIMAVINLF